ncbi:MAG: type II secretion system F family protein [Motilibacteraceae bacterium]
MLYVAVACIGAAMFVLLLLAFTASTASTGVARSLAQIEALGGTLEVARHELPARSRLLDPVGAALAGLARRLTPAQHVASLQRRLDVAGNPQGWSPERILGLKGVGLLVGLGLGVLWGLRFNAVSLLFWALALGAAGLLLPDLLLYNSGSKRQARIVKTLPDALDLLTISVEAGLGFDAALAQVARNTEGPVAAEFVRVLQEMQIGKSRAAAFAGLGERTTVEELKIFVSAVTQADRLGIPIADVLREQAKEMRLKRRQRAEEQAQKVPVKILFPLVLCVLPALFVVVIGPGVIQIVHSFSGVF